MRWLAGLMLLGTLHEIPPPAQSPPDSLAPLAFVVGSCWKGSFPDGRKTDTHCFEWMFDRKFIRDRHVVEGDGGPTYRGETIFGWDAAARRPGYWYWSSEGFVVTGAVEYQEGRIIFPSRMTGPKGDVELEASWTRRGEDAYQVVQRQRTGKGWATLWTMELRRQGASAPR